MSSILRLQFYNNFPKINQVPQAMLPSGCLAPLTGCPPCHGRQSVHMLWPVWSLGLLVLGVGHNLGIHFTFHLCTICEFFIPTLICGCDVIVILSFGIFCLQRVLGPLGATLGPSTLKGAQHHRYLLLLISVGEEDAFLLSHFMCSIVACTNNNSIEYLSRCINLLIRFVNPV